MARQSQTLPIYDRIKSMGEIWIAFGLFSLLTIMVVPMPPWIMDMLLATSISAALLMLLVTFFVRVPVEFSVFPTLLLVTTLFRLSLNVATTRLILLEGASGSQAAGSVIMTFGNVVVGGNYAVGLVVFVILVIINFIVITKGAGRIAEVAARFTLDAMPGKQMAVDAELNSGLIDEQSAKSRREEISREADFYGAMDGASKFIRGDAIAGILITLINIIGGIFIGMVQNDLSLGSALQNYTILTIGDGLVSQIPALIVSSAAGVLVTRVPDPDSAKLYEQFGAQLFGSPRALMMLAGSLLCFAFVPGLRLPFMAIGGTVSFMAWQAHKEQQNANDPAAPPSGDDPQGPSDGTLDGEAPIGELLKVEPIAMELGVDLVGLVDEKKGGNLIERIQRIRRQTAQELGLVVPAVHLRDNLRLNGSEYRLLLRGEEIARGRVYPRQCLAIDPGDARGTLRGIKGKDPVFGLDAFWIPETQRLDAEGKGFTVVDIPTVLTTHLTEILQEYGHELFGRQELGEILERMGEESPRLVEELIPDQLSRGAVLRVFRNLLREGVSIRDAQSVIEGLADHAPRAKDPDVLTEFVRQRLARHITHRFTDEQGALRYVGLAPDAEDAISRGLQGTESGAMNLAIEPDAARRIITGIRDATAVNAGTAEIVVLCPPLARGPFRRLLERVLPRVPVLSPAELLPSVTLERVATVSLNGVRLEEKDSLKNLSGQPTEGEPTRRTRAVGEEG